MLLLRAFRSTGVALALTLAASACAAPVAPVPSATPSASASAVTTPSAIPSARTPSAVPTPDATPSAPSQTPTAPVASAVVVPGASATVAPDASLPKGKGGLVVVVEDANGAPIADLISASVLTDPRGELARSVNEVGPGRIEERELTPGTWGLRISAPGYFPRELTVAIAAGHVVTLTVTLAEGEPTPEPEPGLFPARPVASGTGITVDEALGKTPGETVLVTGFLISTDAGSTWRLCAAVLESFPPQCGRPSLLIRELREVPWRVQREGDVRWVDSATVEGILVRP